MSAGDNSQAFKVEQKQPSLNEKTFKELRIPKTNQDRIYIYIYVCVCVCVCVCMCIFQNIIGYNDSAETCKIRLKSNISSKMAR